VRKTLEERFWDKVHHEPNSGCWLWSGAADGCGYGIASQGFKRTYGSQKAHRVSWVMAGNALSPGAYICHKCDTPACVNPDHLFAGSQADNMRDCVSKGRLTRPRGERHPRTKVSDATAMAILLDSGTGRQAAARFDVSYHTVAAIRGGKPDSWAWLRERASRIVTPEK